MHLTLGALVTVRGERWRLTRIDPYEHCSVLTLDGSESGNARDRLRVIDPFDRVVPAGARRLMRHKRRIVLQRALAAIAHARPARGLWTAAGAAIDLLDYQLEPALAVLGGATRVLLADAVGLGKTIQAGLILAELRERGLVDRALVLCPAGLRATWAAELEQRFHISCDVVDQASIAERTASLPPGTNPWTSHATIVASIDFVKRPEVLAALDDLPIDLVIADEAHHLTPGTDRGAAAARLAARAAWCVLASATPHSGDEAAFAFLTGLGAHGDPLVTFRRGREDAGVRVARREHLLRVRPTGDEAELLAAVERYTRAIWRGRGSGERSAQLVAITIARRAASSHAALERTLARRLALLSNVPVDTQAPLPWLDDEDADGTGDAPLLATPGLDDVADERAAIAHLLSLVHLAGDGAKLRHLSRTLARIREPAIVFTEYRDTLDAVVAALSATHRLGAISGETAIDERHRTIDAFTRGDLDVLVATDIAGEGLSLHQRCRLVIDVELPWNPVRLEQRIGRVDRLGQRRRVHAVRLCHAGTIEHRVLDRLRGRRSRAESGTEGAAVSEIDVARAVFEDRDLPGAASPRPTGAPAPGAAIEGRRLRRQRAAGTSAGDPFVSWASPRHARPGAAVAVHSITCARARGAIVFQVACAHQAWVRWPPGRHRQRSILEHAQSGPIHQAVHEAARELLAAGARDLEPMQLAVASRIAAIRAHLGRERRRARQGSLFDRRADDDAAREARIASRLDEALARRLDSITSPLTVEGLSAQTVAIWPVQSR